MHDIDTPTTAYDTTHTTRVRRSASYHSQRRQLRRVQRAALAVLPYILFLTGLALATLGILSYLEHESPLALFITSRDAVHALADPGQPNLTGSAAGTSDAASNDPGTAANLANPAWPALTKDATGRLIVPFFYIGDPFGTIRIPDVEIDVTAYHGDSETEFRKGVGHYAGSFYPGQGGNILIAGHRNSFFRNFEYLEIGDLVTFETTYGLFEYTITEFLIIKGTDNSIAKDTTKEQLTMYTCYPFTYIGNAPERYVVIAELTHSEVNVQ
ncbi:MAG: class D sortase [Clostridia bacterium]|nr:class D sortase [Clostridia bacterium]